MAAKQKSLVVVTGLRLLMSFCFSLIISPVSLLMGLAMGSVLSWESKMVAIHKVNIRDSIGYGNTFKVIKPLTVAVIPVGYADGYDRKLSNKGEVLISE